MWYFLGSIFKFKHIFSRSLAFRYHWRLYTQLEVLKNKTLRHDNPHISKRRGGRKPAHRRFSLQVSNTIYWMKWKKSAVFNWKFSWAYRKLPPVKIFNRHEADLLSLLRMSKRLYFYVSFLCSIFFC